jgi:hypothetical protein
LDVLDLKTNSFHFVRLLETNCKHFSHQINPGLVDNSLFKNQLVHLLHKGSGNELFSSSLKSVHLGLVIRSADPLTEEAKFDSTLQNLSSMLVSSGHKED